MLLSFLEKGLGSIIRTPAKKNGSFRLLRNSREVILFLKKQQP
jgi:hypothetical protein